MTAAKTDSQAKRDATVEAQRAIQRWSKLLSHTGSRSRASLPNLDQSKSIRIQLGSPLYSGQCCVPELHRVRPIDSSIAS